MKGVGIIPNWQKKNADAVVQEVKTFFEKLGIAVFLAEKTGSNELCQYRVTPGEWQEKVDLVVVVGGDGTILNVARWLAGTELPILGINVGQKGFLAELEIHDITSFLEKVVRKEYFISYRMMIEAEILRKGKRISRHLALNDIVVSKGPFSRIIKLDTYINNDFLESYPGDGLIVSTPTGSTGYSLSAGGPIVNPSLNVLIITPICPHRLYNRSVIVGGEETIVLTVKSQQAEILLTVDGQVGVPLQGNDTLLISKACRTTKLINFSGNSFYKLLNKKLKDF